LAAVKIHARPRYTGDLDILVRPSPENAAKLVSLLRDFGFAKGDLAESDFKYSWTSPSQSLFLNFWSATNAERFTFFTR